MLNSNPLRLYQMKLKDLIFLFPLYKRPNQWLHKTTMMMMAMTTTIYCHKIWMQMYLKILPIGLILF